MKLDETFQGNGVTIGVDRPATGSGDLAAAMVIDSSGKVLDGIVCPPGDFECKLGVLKKKYCSETVQQAAERGFNAR